jgi:glutamate synthase domain-containing protein 3
MSGGIAYVLDADASFARRCNGEFVDLEPLDRSDDVELVMELLKRHVKHTGSTLAANLLTDWSATMKLFVKVMPRDYKRVIEGKSQFGAIRLEPIVLSAFDPATSEVVHG